MKNYHENKLSNIGRKGRKHKVLNQKSRVDNNRISTSVGSSFATESNFRNNRNEVNVSNHKSKISYLKKRNSSNLVKLNFSNKRNRRYNKGT